MSYRLTKIHTHKGDDGYTDLADQRLAKDDLLVEALGSIDELNSTIGFIISLQIHNKKIEEVLTQIQNDLFNFGAELHLPQYTRITAEKILQLEHILDEWNATLPPLKEFILPRGNPKSAAAHIARAVCRRAERKLVTLHRQLPLDNLELLRYLNRLSDLLFVCSRMLSLEDHSQEVFWHNVKC